jgi:hypothetical protein
MLSLELRSAMPESPVCKSLGTGNWDVLNGKIARNDNERCCDSVCSSNGIFCFSYRILVYVKVFVRSIWACVLHECWLTLVITSAKMLTEFQLYPNVICCKDDTRSAASWCRRNMGRTGFHGHCWKRKLTREEDGRK